MGLIPVKKFIVSGNYIYLFTERSQIQREKFVFDKFGEIIGLDYDKQL